MPGPELNFLVHMAFNSLQTLINLLKVKDPSLILSKPFERLNIIPGVGNSTVIESDRSLRGLQHLDSEAGVEWRMGVGEERHEAFGFITEAVEPDEGAFRVFG